MSRRGMVMCAVALCLGAARVGAQDYIPGKVEVAFNRYYDYAELLAHLARIEAAYPELVRVEKIGQSTQGRDLVVAIVNAPRTGSDRDKPAMWIDANVHGNEIQGAEIVLYSVWYLTKAYGVNAALTELLDHKSFYFLPSQNPDGRDWWFHQPNNSSSSRGSQEPVDNDRDGLFDEDGYDDLDGDGSITSMWKEDPDGEWVKDDSDPDLFRRARDGERGGWRRAGTEGVDNDGDGDINEDGPGGDDMNRNWPSDWQPPYVQSGAGAYPLSHPEARSIGLFILDHENVAAVQSYHNAGGMILRGPGASYLDSLYSPADIRVYDEIGRNGERMLPYYRYMIIHKDLYTVHGGFVNWTAEGLGIFSFTNELWTDGKLFQRDGAPKDGDDVLERDRLRFGSTFKQYTEFDHPTHGRVMIGGNNRWAGRVTPAWLLEEECHRNFAFTMYHADQMALLKASRMEAKLLTGDLWGVTVQFENERLIPTRSGIAVAARAGSPDLLVCEPPAEARVLAAGPTDRFDADTFAAVDHEPSRLVLNEGIGGKQKRSFRFLIQGKSGDRIVFRYQAEKAQDVRVEVELGGG